MSDYLTKAEVREIVRPLRDVWPIGLLYATGEIHGDLMAALGWAAFDMGETEGAARILDVLSYARQAGYRPAVKGWTA